MHAVRLTASVPVDPGLHVIDLVVRRVPCGAGGKFVTSNPGVGNLAAGLVPQPVDNRITIYNRQIAVTDNPIEPVSAVEFGDAVVTTPVSDEDVVSRASLLTEGIQPLIDAHNSIESFQVGRGAINRDHLSDYSPVLAVAQSETMSATGIDSTLNRYSWPTSSVVAIGFSRYGVYKPVTWKLLESAALSRVLSGSIANPLDCVLSVEANVFLNRLRPKNQTQNEMHLSAAAFRILIAASSWCTFQSSRPQVFSVPGL